MRPLIVGGIVLITHILSSTIFQYLRIGGITPNFMVMIIVAFSLLRGSKEGALIGVFAGLLNDVTFGTSLGPLSIIYGLTGYICGRLNKNFYRENFIIPFVCTVISSLFVSFSMIFIYLMRGRTNILFFIQSKVIPELIYTATLSLVVYQLLYLLNEKIEDKERKTRNMF